MKKIVLFSLALYAAQAHAFFSTKQPVEQKQNGSSALGQLVFKNIYDKVTAQYPELKESLNNPEVKESLDKVSQGDMSGFLDLLQTALQKVSSSSLEGVSSTLQRLKASGKTLSLDELRGLINKLKAYGTSTPERPVLSGIRLNPTLNQIFENVKDTYKKFISENKSELANSFLQTLTYSIVTETPAETVADLRHDTTGSKTNETEPSLLDTLGKILGL